ncbi:caspase-7-like isoform X2 [Mytilus californianus]|uniref:caspase-7-like isoform X2 n=1 Tax=Mytilus californianus TaxID=6549 RepID=UPI0022462DF7|nr:caspase-7-like isoform X2 [Mytilus californianus]
MSKRQCSDSSGENEYTCNNEFRGLAILICNENFKEPYPTRRCCDDDLQLTKETFSDLKFLVLAFKDLTGRQIDLVLDIGQEEFHLKSDCFVCVIASHGNERPRPVDDKQPSGLYFRDHCVYGIDNEPVATKHIVKKFSEVSSLENKPKLFCIQACRINPTGNISSIDQGHTISVDPSNVQDELVLKNADDIPELSFLDKLLGRKNNTKDKTKIIRVLDPPCDDDCLIVYSSNSEKESYGRHDSYINGGWMLISLYNAMDKHLKALQINMINRIDIMDVIYEMTSYVAKRMEVNLKETAYKKRKAAIVFEHCLHRELYFK